jgi:hypothetical protein
MRVALIFSLLMFGTAAAVPSDRESCGVEVLVSGVPVPSYYHNGRTYIEALRGREYSILLTNPLGSRVAVALSVDGLNTINARRTEARFGHKWILGPHESVVISGWQTGAQHARRFFFTTEERSYGAWLGQTENLGVISAAFFKERIRVVQRPVPMQPLESPQANPQSPRKDLGRAGEAASSKASDGEYAATGIGDRIRHDVEWVQLDLEDHPFATVNLRYEFQPALVKLGVLPSPAVADPLTRRENARGFREPRYCPEP